MANVSRVTTIYTVKDQLFVRWVEQTDWPANYKRVLRLLFEHQRKHGRVFLKHATIAEWLHLSMATVKRALRFLAQLGLVEITPQRAKAGDARENYYKVIPRILMDHADPTPDHRDPTPSDIHKAKTVMDQGVPDNREMTDPNDLFMGKKNNNGSLERIQRRSGTLKALPQSVGGVPMATPQKPNPPAFSLVPENDTEVMALRAAHGELLTEFADKTLLRWLHRYGASPDMIVQWVTWAKDPRQKGYKSRPRNLGGWVDAALRDGRTEPPPWIPQEKQVHTRKSYHTVCCGRCGIQLAVEQGKEDNARCNSCGRPVGWVS